MCIWLKDIGNHNILMNHVPWNVNFCDPKYNTVRQELEENGELLFALFDFDLSLLLNANETSGNIWLPIDMANSISLDPPLEVRYAYAVFDPFKYDVTCLEIHFSEAFWVCVPLLVNVLWYCLHTSVACRTFGAFVGSIDGSNSYIKYPTAVHSCWGSCIRRGHSISAYTFTEFSATPNKRWSTDLVRSWQVDWSLGWLHIKVVVLSKCIPK